MKRRFLRPRLTGLDLTAIIFIIAGAILLLVHLGSLTGGLMSTQSEGTLRSTREIANTAWQNPINLPVDLVSAAVSAAFPHATAATSRLPSAIIAGITLGIMYWLLKQWYGRRLALFGIILLMTSPWLLHSARLANAAIAPLLAMSAILALAAAWHKRLWSVRQAYISCLTMALVIYIPGTVWLLLTAIIIERRSLAAGIKKYYRRHLAPAIVLGMALLTPLAHSLLRNWHNAMLYMGLGTHPTRSFIAHYASSYYHVWQYIFVGGYRNPVYNLGGLALSTILITLAFIVGIYMYLQHVHAVRTHLLIALWFIGTAVAALPGGQTVTLLPIVFVLATGGLGYLLHVWLRVFPRNPYARALGISLIGLVVALGVAYNLRSYYLAWPNNPAVKQEFSAVVAN